MKIDYLSCTKILYFLEKFLQDNYYQMPDINDVFTQQFDMTIVEMQKICDQLEHGKILTWEDKNEQFYLSLEEALKKPTKQSHKSNIGQVRLPRHSSNGSQ